MFGNIDRGNAAASVYAETKDWKDLILESESKDTIDEARIIKSIVGNDKFILVTSASHMPRSMGMFKKLAVKN